MTLLSPLLLLCGLAAWPADAQAHRDRRPMPGSRVVLVQAEGLPRLAAPNERALSVATLASLPQHTVTTTTPWTRESHRYTGVLLRDLLAHLGAHGTHIHATTLTDHEVQIPIEDARLHDVVVAWQVDGQPIPVRQRGPVLVMYPFDADPALRQRRYHERAVWQLRSLSVH